MHKKFVNYCTIDLSIIPDGPILIKSGREGADPTNPDMEFVRTFHSGGWSIYLPGSGLKGAIRAHAERIVRTVGSDTNTKPLWANDPMKGDYLPKNLASEEIYKQSSFTDQIFGNTSIASRIRIEDAHPVDLKQVRLEERNGVAIDRVFGSVAVGPFNYQVCTAGEFKTKIHLKNFTLAQLGLIGLVLRDLNDAWFGLGFAKSRGLGTVRVEYNSAVVQYPGCQLNATGRKIRQLGHSQEWDANSLLGVGEFLTDDEARKYEFPKPDQRDSEGFAESMDLGIGVKLTWGNNTNSGVKDLFERAVTVWSEVLAA
ncbi:RAMP superfamily CRISPR-associated protein [Nodularia sp. UHCC 0506]|uniref:RAMP superfamily CRISPR-associated protein n=1 Tax=Nodularia sp. UHCC 0506 TaxID=3110243 RepID=UPI002B209B0F|nr:RAMP superfamily CRISPR-associated protein [Nodularia sp. UHCC 0506]MEA5513322.1 RAMP superfamily CRISPR-associated protein [Nodularia sp. UHCC 0506]